MQQVVVRGWDPNAQREVVGTATAPTIPLVPNDPHPDAVFGQTFALAVDRPIFSKEEAEGIAKSKLDELLLSYVSGEALVVGNPELKPRVVVTIDAVNDRFDGQYYVVGATHRYSHGDGCNGEYKTAFRGRRTDLGLVRIPRIDDEVLIAFEHGDLRHPVIVGSLWDTDDSPSQSSRSCRTTLKPSSSDGD